MSIHSESTLIALSWCLNYENSKAAESIDVFRSHVQEQKPVPDDWYNTWRVIQSWYQITPEEFPDYPIDLVKQYPELCQPENKIGLVYGGATKIKQYVFETENLQDIRGASALLDQINLVDLPAFFGQGPDNPSVAQWLDQHYPSLRKALIPELIIYSTGGNILAFCPAPYVHTLADAIERYYTEVTLTANSCAVGETFKLLEFQFGLLDDQIENTPWLEQYSQIYQLESSNTNREKNVLESEIKQQFQQQKNFNQLVTKLTIQFNQRRSGNQCEQRNSVRSYPPMYETHPYAQRDDSDRRSAVGQATVFPSEPKLSEASARKRLMGQLTKYEEIKPDWISPISPHWTAPNTTNSWVAKFLQYLKNHPELETKYDPEKLSRAGIVKEARSLPEIGQTSDPEGYIAYIYADGNNMGQYIQKQIRSPQAYQAFSEDIFTATEQAVYRALASHLSPQLILREGMAEKKTKTEYVKIHPFEIIAIGGDDVFLVVPARQALDIAKTIGEEFEKILLERNDQTYRANHIYQPEQVHRCTIDPVAVNSCKLSLSTGVLITAENTPVYYAQRLVEQLLKSAKKRAKHLKERGYLGGTVDFLVMKSVTMVSSDLNEFRQQALTKVSGQNHDLKLYGGPYTLHELGALLQTSQGLKQAHFPNSQLYQIRSFLKQGKQIAILNYRYFQARLSDEDANGLKAVFDYQWCNARTNNGNLAPWISMLAANAPTEAASSSEKTEKAIYETIWWDLVDLYPFVEDGKGRSRSRAKHKPKVTVAPTNHIG
ncbi:type III-B CRISPR-associated protein Cas10/Cmr2 [Alkalinema pantanalense CENA528]|uniref:type III-B CRISPR-associated protein Cas10/Cmr2 n=1 Tax=Alkalinema pantanalense TaxID=1620705 RepID=UPI003D6EC5AF